MMHFSSWEPVYYQMDSNEPGSNFPSRSNDKNGHWVGFADNVGNQLNWKILTEDAHQIIFRSSVHSTLHSTLSLQQELSSRRAPLLLLLQPPFPTLCLNLKHTSSGNMLMEVDWGGNLKHNYTSSGSMLMEVDWGDKLIINSMVDWRSHETHQNGHNISEIDWGGHGSRSNHMTEFLLSEVDWGAHDTSFFLFLVNIDCDAKPMESFTQELRGELQQTMSSTPLIGHMTDSLDTSQTEDDGFNPKPINPELNNPEQVTGESIQPYLSLVGQLHWLVTLGRLVTHVQVTRLPMFRSTP